MHLYDLLNALTLDIYCLKNPFAWKYVFIAINKNLNYKIKGYNIITYKTT